jgi:aminoglycoside phosphotransferase (APT) family kinase protein
MTALWQSPLGTSGRARIAEPLAYVPELALLLQGPVPIERTFKDLTRAAFEAGTADALGETRGFLEQTAAGLAELHLCGAAAGEVVTWADKLEDIAEVGSRVTELKPALAAPTARLLQSLDEALAGLDADRLVPSHGSFRPNQVGVAGDGIGFIDFDRFCAAEPSLDVSSFLTAFRDAAFRAAIARPEAVPADELARIDELSERFLDCYTASAPISRERLNVWQGLAIFDTVLDCWIKLEPGLRERLHLLAHHLDRAGLAP